MSMKKFLRYTKFYLLLGDPSILWINQETGSRKLRQIDRPGNYIRLNSIDIDIRIRLFF